MQIFTIRDSKAQAYLQPFFAANVAVAQRYVETAANDPEHEFHVHAEDYHLYEIGSFSEEDGYVSSTDPVIVAKVIDLIRPDQADWPPKPPHALTSETTTPPKD